MIKLDSIRMTYRSGDVETTALDDIHLQIESGEFVAVMGPSGCGKSTLLNIVGLIDTPSAGSYTFDGEELSRLGEKSLAQFRKRNLGFIFQNFNLIDDLSVLENVELPLLYQKVPRAQRRERAHQALSLVNLRPRANHRPEQLSGGQQQRVAIARAVVSEPRLILADEPTGNLDSVNGEEVMTLLEALNRQGTTILMVTHSPSHGARADRIVNMLDGRVAPAQRVLEAI